MPTNIPLPEQDFIAPWSENPCPPPGNAVPYPRFRWKNGVLQQLHDAGKHAQTGCRWWINVPVADDFEPDVVL